MRHDIEALLCRSDFARIREKLHFERIQNNCGVDVLNLRLAIDSRNTAGRQQEQRLGEAGRNLLARRARARRKAPASAGAVPKKILVRREFRQREGFL